ncbi:MAG: DUF1574 domain-containing protein, partial [Planctomycetia bacterium]|nr:DUF1574 domain-containing protein [Planctomycetia bacterium]
MSSFPPSQPLRGYRQRSAAFALVFGFALAASVQLISGWAIRTDRVALRDPQYTDKLAQLREHAPFASPDQTTTVLFLGSSRTLDGIDAGAVGSLLTKKLSWPVEAFNFAHAGAGPVTNAIYLRRLRKDGVKPDVVVIEVHPAFLAAQLDSPPEAR